MESIDLKRSSTSTLSFSLSHLTFFSLSSSSSSSSPPSSSSSSSCSPLRRHHQPHNRAKSPKGASFEAGNRRRGRPAWRRSPDDSPLRDGNRDRLVGLLTQRATRTLATYLSEMNLNHYHWLIAYERSNEIPRDGAWEDVSGQTFLRNMLSMPIGEAKYDVGRPAMYDHVKGMGVDPRSMAQRIMDIRSQLAREWVEDLSDVSEENALLLRETAAASLRTIAEHPFDSSTDEESGGSGAED